MPDPCVGSSGDTLFSNLPTNNFTATPFFAPDTEDLRFLPEGPRVLRSSARLGWVAIQHSATSREGSFNILDLHSGQNEQHILNGRPGFFAETSTPDVIVIGLERRLVLFNYLTGQTGDTLAELDCPDDVIINDGLAVDGGILFGTKHLKFNEPKAALYYFNSSTRRVHTVVDRQICSNGKCLRRQGNQATLIDIDSTPKTITRYRLDAALEHILEQSLLVPPERLPALPDGLRPSPAHDSVIVAFYNPAAVADGIAQEISLADGSVITEWTLPGSPRVTCPEFVELDGAVKILFTTATEGMDDATRRIAKGAGYMYIADTAFDRMPPSPSEVRYLPDAATS